MKGVNTLIISKGYLFSYMLEFASIWKEHFPAKTVEISGSIGKTTTEMIGKVLGNSLNMFRAKGNKNTTVQIASLICRLNTELDAYVQEASGSYLSQLENSTRMLCSDIFVLTNIGNGHIGNYDGEQKLLLYEKLALDRNAAPEGVGIINWDDSLLKKVHYDHRIVRIAIDDKDADIIADNVVTDDGMYGFILSELLN